MKIHKHSNCQILQFFFQTTHKMGSYYSLDWTTGLEYWTWHDIFLVFTHVVVSVIDSHWWKAPKKPAAHPINGEWEQ